MSGPPKRNAIWEKRTGKRLIQKRRWDLNNRYTNVCPDCGTQIKVTSTRCTRCAPKARSSTRHGAF